MKDLEPIAEVDESATLDETSSDEDDQPTIKTIAFNFHGKPSNLDTDSEDEEEF